MTLDEAIVHATDCFMQMGCTECGKEHMQLANWLKELKDYRAFVSDMHVGSNAHSVTTERTTKCTMQSLTSSLSS